MGIFVYTARDASGKQQKGTAEANAPAEVAAQLRSRGLIVLNVRAVEHAPELKLSLAERLSPGQWMPPRTKDIEIHLQQLAIMVRNGLTLLNSIRTLVEQSGKASLKQMWVRIAERIQEGSTLADAMSEHKCFPKLAIELTRVGEQTGALDVVLTRAADILERRRAIRSHLISAMSYPVMILVLTFGVTSAMLYFLIPKLDKLLKAMGRPMPPTTQFLLDTSEFARDSLPQIVTVFGLGIVAFVLVLKWPPGRLWFDRIMLRIPIVGNILRLAGTVMFARSLGTLTSSGIRLLEAMRTVEPLVKNRFLARVIGAARLRVMQGTSLAEPLAERYAFTPMLSRMVAVGEQSGTLDEVLEEVARFHETQLQRLIKTFSATIEPVMIVVVGSIVGFVYMSVFQALYSWN